MILYDSRGRGTELGKRIAGGGEGEVFAVAHDATSVAKVFHATPSSDKVAKLHAMVAGPDADLAKLTCWPAEILTDRPNGGVRGFLMPSAMGSKEIHLLYNPKSRAAEFASVQWQFLIAAAANIARAFAVVHRTGHVIGDVNHSSVMIASNATVRLIDCDSFQIRAAGRLFRCEVGEPGHTAPELQGKVLAREVRTPNHDNFGLAVLIFELLFMGRHPFGGQFIGNEALSLEEKIARFLFAYGPGASARQMRQPPHTLNTDGVSPRVSTLFEAAFGPNGPIARPSAAEWASALDELCKSTIQCSLQRGHFFYRGQSQCPWCPIEAKLGLSLFTVRFAVASKGSEFNLSLVWDSIQKVPRPIPSVGMVPANGIVPGVASVDFTLSGRERRRHVGALYASIILTVCVSVVSIGLAFVPFIIFLVVFGACVKNRSKWSELRRDARARVGKFKAEYESARVSYQHWSDGHLFSDAMKDLEGARDSLLALPQAKERAVTELRNRAESVLRKQFLNSHQIRPGIVSGIGPSRCADLQFYNIETAADIEWYAVLQVPGFGPTRASSLMSWRQAVESQFRFDPKSISNTPEFRRIESDYYDRQKQLELALAGGAKRLEDLSSQIKVHRTRLEPKVRAANLELAQALADLKAV